MSSSVNESATCRSLPTPVCTPSHHPWYAPWNWTISGLRVLKRARRTAHMTASVPLMWKETCSGLGFGSGEG